MTICFYSYIFFRYVGWLNQWFIWCWILVLKLSSKSQHNFLKHKFGHISSVLEPFSASHSLQKSTRSRRKEKKVPGRLFVQSQATLSTLQSMCSKGCSHVTKQEWHLWKWAAQPPWQEIAETLSPIKGPSVHRKTLKHDLEEESTWNLKSDRPVLDPLSIFKEYSSLPSHLYKMMKII